MFQSNQKYEQNVLIKSALISALVTLSILGIVGWFFYQNRMALVENFATQYENELRDQLTVAGESNFSPLSQEATIVDIVKDSKPAVVSVVITQDVPIIERYYEEFDPFGGFGGRGFNFRIPSEREVGREEREVGGGSGFFVTPDGMIITNRHVVDIEDASYSVVTNEGESFEIEVVARDPLLDIAVLKVVEPPEEDFPHLEFGNSDELVAGQTAIAIGNALAEFRNSVSVGIISGLSRSIVAGDRTGMVESLDEVIQTDAAINPGNSGGPLLDSRGRVIGVNVAVAARSENIGFALPSNVVEDIVESVQEYGEIVRPFLGVRFAQVTKGMAERDELPVEYGALVVRGETAMDIAVLPGSAADNAGIVEGDIIIEIEGVSLKERSLASVIRNHGIGDVIEITLIRDGEEVTVTAVLDKAPE